MIVKNPGLFDCFHDLREQVTLTSHILSDRIKGRKHTIPPVMFQAWKATTSEMTLPVPEGYVPQPSIRHEVDPNIGALYRPKQLNMQHHFLKKAKINRL